MRHAVLLPMPNTGFYVLMRTWISLGFWRLCFDNILHVVNTACQLNISNSRVLINTKSWFSQTPKPPVRQPVFIHITNNVPATEGWELLAYVCVTEMSKLKSRFEFSRPVDGHVPTWQNNPHGLASAAKRTYIELNLLPPAQGRVLCLNVNMLSHKLADLIVTQIMYNQRATSSYAENFLALVRLSQNLV